MQPSTRQVGSTVSQGHSAGLCLQQTSARHLCKYSVGDVTVLWWAGMNACVGLGYVDEAAELLRTMQKSGMRADVRAYNILLKGQANARSLSSMQATMADMERLQVAPSVVTYNILIDAFANEGLLEQVMLLCLDGMHCSSSPFVPPVCPVLVESSLSLRSILLPVPMWLPGTCKC